MNSYINNTLVMTTSTGTGPMVQSGMVVGYAIPVAGDNGKTFIAKIFAVDANGIPGVDWEMCESVYNHSALSWSRGTLLASSTGSRIDFSSGVKRIAVTCSAERFSVFERASIYVSSVNDLTEHAPNGTCAIVHGLYEHGLFVFSIADLSDQVELDTYRALYIAPIADASGNTGAWVRRVVDNTYEADWWLKGDTTLVQDSINRALKQIPINSIFKLPPREMTVALAAQGTVTPASAGPPSGPFPHSGIVNAIYCDKPVTIEGCGYATHLNGQGAALAIIGVRASHCKIRHLRAGNVAGQLYIYESCCVVAHPSNFPQGTATGFDIEDITVEDCDFYACDSGVSGTPESDLTLQNTLPAAQTYYKVTKLNVINCRIAYRRQGIELFACDDSIVRGNRTVGLDKGAFEISRVLRGIGAQRVTITDNICLGFSDDTNGYFGVVMETSGLFHNPPYYELASSFVISNNQFRNFQQSINVEAVRESVIITGNTFRNAHDSNVHFAIRLNAQSFVDEYGSTTNWENKNLAGDTILISDNVCVGAAIFFFNNGTILAGKLTNNLFIGNAATETGLVHIANVLTHPLENVYHFEITRNTAIMNPSADASGTLRFGGLRPGNIIIIDDNVLTPCDGGDGIADVDAGAGATILIRDRYSNVILDPGLWALRYNPPKPEIFGTYPPIP